MIRKAWGVLWLVMAALIVFYVGVAIIEPFLPLIFAALIVGVIAAIAIFIWRFIHKRRRFF